MHFFESPPSGFPLSSVAEYRLLAKKRLPKFLFDFIEGGAFQENTKKRNHQDYESIQLKKRILKDVSQIETEVEVLGQKLAQPLILAPVGFAGLYAKRGEVQAARAAEKAGIAFSLSALGICSMEELHQETLSSFWYQTYMMKERNCLLELLQRARASGCRVLLLTVDLPVMGSRARHPHLCQPQRLKYLSRKNWWNSLHAFLFHTRWFIDVYCSGRPLTLGNIPLAVSPSSNLASMRKWMSDQLDPSFNWKEIEWVRGHWPGKIVLKGILDVEDARIAINSGVDGIVISNHGGRHFDGAPSTIAMLPSIAEKVDGQLDILIDGGISNGMDMAKALALGAKACMVGRPWAFALAARGEKGVFEVINILHRELKLAMAHMGLTSLKQLNRSVIWNFNYSRG